MVCDICEYLFKDKDSFVLILILLEYGLRQKKNEHGVISRVSLNPYSIGIWSATIHWCNVRQNEDVLILILLEYGLRREYSRWNVSV